MHSSCSPTEDGLKENDLQNMRHSSDITLNTYSDKMLKEIPTIKKKKITCKSCNNYSILQLKKRKKKKIMEVQCSDIKHKLTRKLITCKESLKPAHIGEIIRRSRRENEELDDSVM